MKTLIPVVKIFKIELKDGAASVEVRDLIPGGGCLTNLRLCEPVSLESEAWIGVVAGHPPLPLFSACAHAWTGGRDLALRGVLEGIMIRPLVKIELNGFEQESVQIGLQWVEGREIAEDE